ncbi:MAG TPA: winged helix-turn-helix domain-containing protein [Xanthobacteraceae bacterium]|nr:winged helix-turn-helix domain-containing protein [Xanthobacteraceae bacterium]
MSDHSHPAPVSGLAFGPFCLFPSQQLLLEAGKPVRLGSRALLILIALIERAGELVSKEELIARVWPNTFVEEGSIRVHIAALRRILGEGHAGIRYVATVPGRGYSFVAPISRPDELASAPAPHPEPTDGAHNLPAPLTRMVGRAAIVATITAQVQANRLVTLVGPGGIGKTTVAVAVGQALAPVFPDGVRFVDLVPLSDPALVASAVASVVGLPVRSEEPLSALLAFVRDKRTLLVLDNCEHVIGSVATLASRMLAVAPGVHIFATSREPLLVEGEHVRRLSALATPSPSTGITVDDALRSPAVQLFIERASASADGFALSAEDAPIVAEICRRLDGIPLAIELAAGCVDVFGLRAIAAGLDDRFRLLTLGRRTALPRHRSLAAVLDWSHGLLPEAERLILRRVAVFAGEFTLEAASAVVADAGLAEVQVVDGIVNLVMKSLLSANVEGNVAQYRLLDTTRAYARAKLAESGERETFARRHAEYFKTLFERAEAEWETLPTKAWLDAYSGHIDDLRIALDWAFSPGGDVGIGIALVVAAIPLWLQLSLINECRVKVQRALALDQAGGGNDRRTMKLQAALGWSLMYTSGPERETGAAWTAALALANANRNTDYSLRSLWGLWAGTVNNGEFRAALALAQRFIGLAADEADRAIGDRMMGVCFHFLGDQAEARRHVERMLDRYVPPPSRSHVVRFQFDQQVTARITLARVLWLQGFADQAVRICERNIEHALSIDHVLSVCNALVQGACPVALLAGALPLAERFTTLVLNESERHSFQIWHSYGQCFRGELLIKGGDLAAGLPLLQDGIGKLRQAKFVQYYTAFLQTLAESLAAAERVAEAIHVIDEALARSAANEERWCAAELSRCKGELLLQTAHADATTQAEALFAEALRQAREQRALAWELRTAASIARLRRRQGRVHDARALLAGVYSRFTEGFATADLQMADALLRDLG